MKAHSKNLRKLVQTELKPIYIFFAEESIQLSSLTDQILLSAKNSNFEEKTTYIISKDTDWTFLDSNNENLDLFGSKKIIEVKLLGSGPGNKGSKALKEYSLKPDPNKILIVTADSLDKKSQSSAWAKALEEAGLMIIESPIPLNSMPKWIQSQAEISNMKVKNEAAILLSEKTEGNLLAATQEIIKLSLLYPDKEIGLKEMEACISNASKFGIFDLSNAFVSGNKNRTFKIIESLKSDGTQPTLILWALTKEINNLYKVMEDNSTKNIWGPRHYLETLTRRVNELSKSKIKESILKIAEIDASIKGLSSKNPWQAIRDLALTS
jgi:DNA polymerase-3 subunit delta